MPFPRRAVGQSAGIESVHGRSVPCSKRDGAECRRDAPHGITSQLASHIPPPYNLNAS
jgi:hypothetical protein